MNAQPTPHVPGRRDGFGARVIEVDRQAGRIEVLALSPPLATPAAEAAIRTRAARLADGQASMLAAVLRIGREGPALSITSTAPEAVTLADLLAALEFGTVTLPDEAVLELAGATIGSVSALHALPGSPAHGALNPAHVLLRREGGVLLTGAIFGDALQALECNREQLWRTFGIALPPSASVPRFNQRADVTQLGALVLAILLRRTLAAAEYPKSAADLAAAAGALAAADSRGSALRMWLQQALQLHPKAAFASAIDAAQAFGEAMAPVRGRRAGAQALRAVVTQLCSAARPERV